MTRKWVFKNTVAAFLSLVMMLTCLPFDLVANASNYVGECCYCGGAVYENIECKCGFDDVHHCEDFDCYMDNHCMGCGNGVGQELGMLTGAEDGWCPIGGQGSHCVGCLMDEYGFKECPMCGEEYCPICQGMSFEDYGCESCYGCMNCWRHCPECGACDQEVEYCDECQLCINCCLEQNLHCENCEACFANNEYCPICGYCDNCIDGWHCENCGYCHDGDTDAFCDICGLCEFCPDYAHCPDCERCFEEIDKCDTCGRCVECCEEDAYSMGCDCGDWVCTQDSNFSEHMEEFHKDATHIMKPSNTWSFDQLNHWKACVHCSASEHISSYKEHTFNKDGVCSICGYNKKGGYIILEQPKSVSVKTSIPLAAANNNKNDPRLMKNNTVTFHVKAYCDNPAKAKQMYYHWQITFDGGEHVYQYFDDREGSFAWGIFTDTLTYGIDTDLCKYYGNNFCAVRCHITDRPYGASDPIYNVYTEWAKITPQHNYEVEQKGFAGHYWKCLGEECENTRKVNDKTIFSHIYADWEENDYGLYTYCTVCGFEKEITEHTHYYDQDTIETYKHKDPADFVEEYADNTRGRYQYRSESNKNLYFGANQAYHWGTCGELGCEHPVTEPHDWILNKSVDDYSTSGDLIYRICRICGYEDVFQENGIWDIGTHVMVYTDCSGSHTVAKDGDTVQLFRRKIPGKKFDHWEVEADHLVGAPKQSYYRRDPVPEGCLNAENDTLLVQDKLSMGKWYVTAVMEDCNHKTADGKDNTSIVGKRYAGCTRFGYTGDTVCNECGMVLEHGKDIMPTGHGELVLADEDIIVYRTIIVNGVEKEVPVTNKNGDPMYEVRKPYIGDCTHKGYSGDMVCVKCGEVVEHGKTTDYHHDLRTARTPKYTCINDGKDATLLTWCQKCDYQHYTNLGQLHDPANLETVNVVEAGCTTKGCTGDTYCTKCNKIVEKGKEIAPTGHMWKETVKKQATETSQGRITKKCLNCGMEKTITTPKLTKLFGFTFEIPKHYQDYDFKITNSREDMFHIYVAPYVKNIDPGAFFKEQNCTQSVTGPFVPGQEYFIKFYIAGRNYNELTDTARINVKNVTASYTITVSPKKDEKGRKYVVVPFTAIQYWQKGDVNHDGSVDRIDANLLSRYVAGWDGYEEKIFKDCADLNGDTEINRIDANILSRCVADWDGYREKYIK